MRSYKYLVMQSNDNNTVGFLTANFSGTRCAHVDTNITHFKPHDFGGGHQNDEYWNSAEELLVGFSRWYLRTDEKESYHMSGRIYSATNTYRFFRIDEDMDTHEADQVDLANKDLASFEIAEEEFINNIINSWAFKQIRGMFPTNTLDAYNRSSPKEVEVEIVYNNETLSWCWISDYLKFEQEDHLKKITMKVPIGLVYEDVVEYISKMNNCDYRFGGNDAYNKRKAVKEK